MTEAFEVLIPLLNPNEPEAQVTSMHVIEGQRVSAGDLLCMLETTKSSAEITAEREGFVVGLQAAIGDMMYAGERLCWLAVKEGWRPPELVLASEGGDESSLPAGLRITEPALSMARESGLDLSVLPTGPLVTQETVRKAMLRGDVSMVELPEGPFDPQAVVVYGGGGHGKSLIDLIRSLENYQLVGLIDDGIPNGEEVMGLNVLGGGEILSVLWERGLRMVVNAVGGVGDIMSRVRVFERILEEGFNCPTLIHPAAIVEPSARLADGVQVFPHAYIGSESSVAFGAIINTSAVVSHDCRIGKYANVAPGALIAGGVEIGEKVLIGMGVTINLNVSVGEGSRVGNSAVVKRDVPPGTILRAGSVWPSESDEIP